MVNNCSGNGGFRIKTFDNKAISELKLQSPGCQPVRLHGKLGQITLILFVFPSGFVPVPSTGVNLNLWQLFERLQIIDQSEHDTASR